MIDLNVFVFNELTKQIDTLKQRKGKPLNVFVGGIDTDSNSQFSIAKIYLTLDIFRRILTDYFNIPVQWSSNLSLNESKYFESLNIRKPDICFTKSTEFDIFFPTGKLQPEIKSQIIIHIGNVVDENDSIFNSLFSSDGFERFDYQLLRLLVCLVDWKNSLKINKELIQEATEKLHILRDFLSLSDLKMKQQMDKEYTDIDIIFTDKITETYEILKQSFINNFDISNATKHIINLCSFYREKRGQINDSLYISAARIVHKFTDLIGFNPEKLTIQQITTDYSPRQLYEIIKKEQISKSFENPQKPNNEGDNLPEKFVDGHPAHPSVYYRKLTSRFSVWDETGFPVCDEKGIPLTEEQIEEIFQEWRVMELDYNNWRNQKQNQKIDDFIDDNYEMNEA